MSELELRSVYRVTVFIPAGYLRAVIDSVKQAWPLGDDHYDSVLWFVEDACEEFRARARARPARGEIDRLHRESVSMLVFSVPLDSRLLDRVINEGIRSAHPWEAPGVFVDAARALLPKQGD